MKLLASGCLAVCLLVASAPAQNLPEGIAAAEARIEAGELTEALAALIALQERAGSDAEREQLAYKLLELGVRFQAKADKASQLRACETALAVRMRIHGERDHVDVAIARMEVAKCLGWLGRPEEGLAHSEAALNIYMRLASGRDDADVATSLAQVGISKWAIGRGDEALPQLEAALAMHRRLHGKEDHSDIVLSLTFLGHCLDGLGRVQEALQRYEEALAMCRRLYGDRDDPQLASSIGNVALGLKTLGRLREAVAFYEAELAMKGRLLGGLDDAGLATCMSNMAVCLDWLGRMEEALPHHEAALEMRRRLYGNGDHPGTATCLSNLAMCLEWLGRPSEALPQYELALAMFRRLSQGRDNAQVAAVIDNIGRCLRLLGRADEALQTYQTAWAMRLRVFGARDHPDVALSHSNLGECLEFMERWSEAVPHLEAALRMHRSVFGEQEHPHLATALANLSDCLSRSGRAEEALPHSEAALAMRRKLYRDRDHREVAASLNGLGLVLGELGRTQEALLSFESALAMQRRLLGDRDHADTVTMLDNPARCLESLGRFEEALAQTELACAMTERLRDRTSLSAGLRQSYFDLMKYSGAFERQQALTVRLGRPAEALHAAERSRGRGLLDLLEQQQFDPLDEAERRARLRGDEAVEQRLHALRTALAGADVECDRLLNALTELDGESVPDEERQARRAELLAQSDAASLRQRQLLDERGRLLGDVLPVGRVRTAPEIQSVLRDGELLLEFTIDPRASYLYVLAREGDAQSLALPQAAAAVERLLPDLLQRCSREQLAVRGRDPTGRPATDPVAEAGAARQLFESLIPTALWPRIQAARRVLVAGHRGLHRLPFEMLVTDVRDGKPARWLDQGPPVAYVPSGSALHWLRQRAPQSKFDDASSGLLAVGDPSALEVVPQTPAEGVFVLAVADGGEGARAGLRPGDVLGSYDGQVLVDDKTLRDARMATDQAVASGRRGSTPVAIELWRAGATLKLDVKPGTLGIQVAPGKAREALEAAQAPGAQLEKLTRSTDLERLRRLPPLQGARSETEAIGKMFAERGQKVQRLLGQQATESAVFALAPKANYLHFACHGLAEEYAGQSLSMLVLSQPKRIQPDDDGLLKLGDLLHSWRGHLSACRLVVLSACRTNVGPTFRDEAPQALPIGFLFAGAPAVISSLWAVDDASTRELMVDFYGRLLAGEPDPLAALHAAKKALRQKHADPFYWAPFLYLGNPE